MGSSPIAPSTTPPQPAAPLQARSHKSVGKRSLDSSRPDHSSRWPSSHDVSRSNLASPRRLAGLRAPARSREILNRPTRTSPIAIVSSEPRSARVLPSGRPRIRSVGMRRAVLGLPIESLAPSSRIPQAARQSRSADGRGVPVHASVRGMLLACNYEVVISSPTKELRWAQAWRWRSVDALAPIRD